MKKWIVIPCVFAGVIVLDTVLAWGGSKFALITLAVTSVMVCGFMAVHGYGWRQALDGWNRSTGGWAAAQKWGMHQDLILRDALKDLSEYDEEAAEIHSGRSINASLEYLRATFNEEDAKEIAQAIKGGL